MKPFLEMLDHMNRVSYMLPIPPSFPVVPYQTEQSVRQPHEKDPIAELKKRIHAGENIETLALCRCRLSDENVKELMGLLHGTNIKTLDLSDNEITEVGAGYLGEFLKKNNTVEFLNVRQNNIKLTGGFILAASLEFNYSIVVLKLDYENTKATTFTHRNIEIQQAFEKIGAYKYIASCLQGLEFLKPVSSIVLSYAVETDSTLAATYLEKNLIPKAIMWAYPKALSQQSSDTSNEPEITTVSKLGAPSKLSELPNLPNSDHAEATSCFKPSCIIS